MRRRRGKPQAPGVWVDLGRPALPPLPSPSELLQREGDRSRQLAAIEAAAGEHRELAQGPLLAELGAEELLERMLADSSPLPSADERARYFFDRHITYWISGLADLLLLERILEQRGTPLGAGSRVLDLGCSSGRVLRHLARRRPPLRALGADVNSQAIAWARLHLPAAAEAMLTSITPALPLPDGSVDLLFAASVFTHIADFEEAWIREVARVLAPAGVAVITIHPERAWQLAADPLNLLHGLISSTPHRVEPGGEDPVSAEIFERPMPAERVVFRDLASPIVGVNVVHSHAWIRRRWGRALRIEQIVERAHSATQDAVVLSRADA